MKKTTLSKIFGVAVVIALLASLIIAAVPTSALTITSASPASPNISTPTDYTIKFTGSYLLTGNAVPDNADSVTVTFPTDTTFASILGYDSALTSFTPTTADTVTFDPGSGTAIDLTALTTITPAARIVTFTLPEGMETEGLKPWIIVIKNVSNPSSPGSYALSVATSQETTAVTSSTYTIGIPVVVSNYNSAGNFTGSFVGIDGKGPLQQALSAATNGSTIKLGAGTYQEASSNTVVSAGEIVLPAGLTQLTITTTGSAADTIIQNAAGKAGAVFEISASTDTYITVDNITFVGRVINNGAHVTFQNCVFNYPGGPGPLDLFTNNTNYLTIKNCTFDTTANANTYGGNALVLNDVCAAGTPIDSITNSTFKVAQTSALVQDIAIKSTNSTNFSASSCTFTGSSAGIGYKAAGASAIASISNSTFTSLMNAVYYSTDSTLSFSGNTVDASVAGSTTSVDGAILITTAPTYGTNSIVIAGNTISNSTGHSVQVTAGATDTVAITGNSFSSNTKGFLSVPIAAQLNYWGSAAGPNATGSDIIDSTATIAPSNYTPWLGSAVTAANATFSTKDTLQNFDFTATGSSATYISNATVGIGTLVVSQKLAANPSTLTPPYPAVAYFDIYTSAASSTTTQINFYATGITTATQVYYYSGAQAEWVLCDLQGVAGTGAYVWVSLSATSAPGLNDLTGTYFALVEGLEKAPESFDVNSPELGSTTTLTNIPFSWDPYTGATSYEFILSANADLSSPVVDQQNLSGTAFTYTGTLQAGPYYWVVNAYLNNAIKAKSVTGTFIAAAPTTTATTTGTVITITSVPAPTITITQPAATTITIPAAQVTEITPAWIWGIIGIGAVLIIVVIVLIVRTRRSV